MRWLVLGCSGGLEASAPFVLEEGNREPLVDQPLEKLAADRASADGSGPAAFGGLIAAQDPLPAEAQERLRSWFPESFLWRPLVETDVNGTASVEIIVPDSLTTWRVLALAHDRNGRQGGAVTTFGATLPAYVDPAVPGWLTVGDRVLVPIQIVSTLGSPVPMELDVRASGALVGSVLDRGTLTGTDVRWMPLEAAGAGVGTVRAALIAGDHGDSAERTVPILPAGRPVVSTGAGALGAERSFELKAPPGADPTTDRLEVRVFPGPSAVVAAEAARLAGDPRPADPVYALALADPDLRRARMLARQRLVYAALSPDPGVAADLLATLRDANADDPLVSDVRPRLVSVLLGAQRADGTWSRSDDSTLQQVLVQTAFAARALPDAEITARLRAMGALDRHFGEVDDPYTASVLVAAGVLAPDAAETLRARVRDEIAGPVRDGTALPSLRVDVRTARGEIPFVPERLAWAALALPSDDPLRADVAARLLGEWSPEVGFGAGRADVLALEVVRSAAQTPSHPVTIELRAAERALSVTRLDPANGPGPQLLEIGAGAVSSFVLAADPPAPGLLFVATRRSWVPWTAEDRLPGVEVRAAAPGLRVGVEGTLTLEIAAPAGAVVHVEQGIPAGAVVGDAQSDARLEVLSDRIAVKTRPFFAGEVQTLMVPITPAYAGRFQTAPLRIGLDGSPLVSTRPLTWVVSL